MPADTFSGVTVARILRPRGLRGEVAAEILTDFPERLPNLREVWLADGRGAPRVTKVQRCWLSTSRGGQAMRNLPITAASTPGGENEIDLPLAGLAAGDYIVEVTAASDAGNAKDRVTFRVTS